MVDLVVGSETDTSPGNNAPGTLRTHRLKAHLDVKGLTLS